MKISNVWIFGAPFQLRNSWRDAFPYKVIENMSEPVWVNQSEQ